MWCVERIQSKRTNSITCFGNIYFEFRFMYVRNSKHKVKQTHFQNEQGLFSYLILLTSRSAKPKRETEAKRCFRSSNIVSEYCSFNSFIIKFISSSFQRRISLFLLHNIFWRASSAVPVSEEDLKLLYQKLFNYGFHSHGLYFSVLHSHLHLSLLESSFGPRANWPLYWNSTWKESSRIEMGK